MDVETSSSASADIQKNLRYTGTARRPYSADQTFKNLESSGWSVTPKEPTLDTYEQVAPNQKPVITRQDLFESKQVNLLNPI